MNNLLLFIIPYLGQCLQDDSNPISLLSLGEEQDSSTLIVAFIFGAVFLLSHFHVCMLMKEGIFRFHLIQKYRIENAMSQCTEVDANNINLAMNHKLVHCNGMAHTDSPLVDDLFGMSMDQTVKLTRKVEMYQWVEHNYNNRRHSSYHTLEWSETFHQSDRFSFFGYLHDQNEYSKWVVEKQQLIHPIVTLGSFQLNENLIAQFSRTETIYPTAQHAENVRRNLHCSVHPFIYNQGEYIRFSQSQVGPINGDLRVSFTKVPCTEITVIAEQQDNRFVPWKVHDKYEYDRADGCCSCCTDVGAPLAEVNWLMQNHFSMFQAFYYQFDLLSSGVCCSRCCFGLFLAFGLYLVFFGLKGNTTLIPFISQMLSKLDAVDFFLLSFLISIPVIMVTIGCGQLKYQPISATIWLGLGVLIGFIIYQLSFTEKSSE